MSFASLEFLFFFFPVVVGINYILPRKVRNYWLFFASLFFYAWGEPTFFLLLILSITVNYILGLVLEWLRKKTVTVVEDENASYFQTNHTTGKKTERIRKAIFIITLLLNFGLFFVFKYLNVLTELIRSLIPAWQGVIPQTSFVLPLAISFYTFQSVSYIIDIYRGMEAEKNPFYFALFIMFFPQLLQGPILRYGDFRPQLANRKTTSKSLSEGIILFLTGFNQKVLMANILSELTDVAFGARELSVGMAWLGMLSYSLQLYFDFSGYSDMAIGLGQMFGFQFNENFNFPYVSKSVSEFWRRWHISLGAWFRDYLYFPLGGSRVDSKTRLIFNLMVVWLATGIWHGADLTFILWGVLQGVFIVFEKLTDLPKRLESKPIAQNLYRAVVLFEVIYGMMLFRAADVSQAINYTHALFRLDGNLMRDSLFKFYSREYLFTLIFAVFCAFPWCKKLRERISAHGEGAALAVKGTWYLIQLLLAVVSLSCLVMGSYNPFVYAKF